MSDHPTVEGLIDHACGLLGDRDARAIQAHLGECAPCADAADRFAKERNVVTQALRIPTPPGLAYRILDGVPAKSADPRPRHGGRWSSSRWQVAAAILGFAAIAVFIYGTARPSDTSARVVSGQVLVEGVQVVRIPPRSRILVAGDHPATIVVGDGSDATLYPGSEAVFTPHTIEIAKGRGEFRIAPEGGPLRLSTPAGTLTVPSAKFTVELRPAEDKGGKPMEHLLAMVVAVLSGDVQADVAGKSYALGAGQGGNFSTELVSLSPRQGDDEKEKKDKKKGKKKEGEGKDEKDGDNNEKGKNEKGKQNDQGKNEKGKKDNDD